MAQKRLTSKNKIPATTKADGSLYNYIKETIASARKNIHKSANFNMVKAYWLIGKRISETYDNAKGPEYGNSHLQKIAIILTDELGQGFDYTNLTNMKKFYSAFRNVDTLCQHLSWSHYRLLIRIANKKERHFYMNESNENSWTVRNLEQQINSSYYERLLATHKKRISETPNGANEKMSTEPEDYVLKDPLILDFIGLNENRDYLENNFEKALINNLQKFLLELGKGFSFVGRQYRIDTETSHFYIDLVFYNYKLKCFVLIDLKTEKLMHQDIGQMDMYIRMFDDLKKGKDDNPTIGIILAKDRDNIVAKYSVLNDKKNIFATKYKLYLPSEEELVKELEMAREHIKSRYAIAGKRNIIAESSAQNDESKIVKYLKKKKNITSKTASELIGKSDRTARRLLNKMTDKDILSAEGETKKRAYALKRN